jgi:hypothetical protein
VSYLDTGGCSVPGKYYVIVPIDAIEIRKLSELGNAHVANLLGLQQES